MSDQPTVPQNQPVETPETDATTQPSKLIFKVGANRIVADENAVKLSSEQARTFLKAAYPEVVNATIRERIEGDTRILEFLAQPGRKG